MHTNLLAYVVVLTSVFGGYEQNNDLSVGQTHLFSPAYAAKGQQRNFLMKSNSK
jgi:hypothetical protein